MLDRLKKEYRLIKAYKSLFNSEDGSLVLKNLLQISGYFCPVSKPSDIISTAFADGKRAMMTEILRRTNVSQERIVRVFKELNEEAENKEYDERNDK